MELNRIEVEELLKRYAAGERNFSNCWVVGELRGINLEGAILVNADFAEQDMTGARLVNTNLSGACLEQALLHDADLSAANSEWCLLE